jgi:hypothetical protein
LLIDRDVDPEEINMAVRSEERDQDDKQAACEGGLSSAPHHGGPLSAPGAEPRRSHGWIGGVGEA